MCSALCSPLLTTYAFVSLLLIFILYLLLNFFSMHFKVFSNSFSHPSDIALSSTNLIVLTFCHCILTPDLLSFISSITFSINKLKKIGDRLQPCLTPFQILASSILSSTFISAFCSLYRSHITLLYLYFTPISFNVLNNLAHSTLSIAFSRSTNTTYVSSPFFSLFSNISLKDKTASLVSLPLLNCLTPFQILASSILSSTFISAFCSLYRSHITLLYLYFTPISFNVLNNLAHSTLSIAFSRSTNTTYVSSPFFSLFSNISLKDKTASLVSLPLLNPNCCSPTLSSILPYILLCTILVKILDACGNKLITKYGTIV
ncbi:hypothetical protein PGB90_001155 [Kerria lacca]